MERAFPLLISAVLALLSVAPSPAVAQAAAEPRLRISATPAVITVGQAAQVCVRTLPGERVALHAYTLPSRTYRVVRTGSSAGTLPCWTITPAADTRLFASVIGGPASRSSASTVVDVRPSGSACGARAPLFSHPDSAQCLYQAFRRGDRATALRYAVPRVVDELWTLRQAGLPPWAWSGCGEPLVTVPSSGTSCYYDERGPVGVGHGVTLELGMSRTFRVEVLDNIG